MDVAKPVVLSFSVLSLCTACGQKQKVADPQFPTTKAQCQATAIPDQFLVKWKDGSISIERSPDKETFVKEVLDPNRDEIEFAEHDQRVSLEQVSPQATYISGINWGQRQILVDDAWNAGITGEGVKVAVIDSGVDITHPQLKNKIARNEAETANGVDDDGNGLVDDIAGYDFARNSPDVSDSSGHGTHVSGVIVADSTQGTIEGLAPGARLLPLDFMDARSGTLGDAIRAIHYAVSRGVRVINASWGGAPCSQTLLETIRDLEKQNVLFVVAAGNAGHNLDAYPEYPAAFDLAAQITVGASTSLDNFADFSNESYSLVHLVAPGVDIVSTYPEERIASLDGTSMAAPFVTGAAALLWSARPTATVAQIKQALLESVDPGYFPVKSRGRLNVKKSLERISELVP